MEIREDILGRKVLFKPGRSKRPVEFKEKKKKGVCYFCPGNEKLTPPEVMRKSRGHGWEWRIFRNKFPILKKHDVLVDTPEHGKDLTNLPEIGLNMEEAFKAYQKRFGNRNEYILYFKNSGKNSGASIEHSHCQITRFDETPPEVKKRSGRKFMAYVRSEMESERAVHEVIFMPYASIQPYETWVFPGGFSVADSEWGLLLHAVAKSIRDVIGKFDYNIMFFQSSKSAKVPFHIQILPRINTEAGFEFGSGLIVNTVKPEKAAKEMKKRLRRNLKSLELQ